MARTQLETCPACRQSLPDFAGWPPWCPHCGWNLEPPDAPAQRSSRIATWWRRRSAEAEQAELQRLLADPALLTQRHPRRTAIYAAALAVHAMTLALLAAGAWVMTTDIVTVLKVGAGIIAFGLVLVTVPLHRLRPPSGAGRTEATTTLAVAAEIAAAVGVTAPNRVRVTSYGSTTPLASRRVLTVDVTGWSTLDGAGRVALLAHELAHHNGHDPRRTPLVTAAAETLDGWLGLLRPDPRTAGRRARRVARAGWVGTAPSTAVSISELLLPVAIAPIYGSVLAAGWVLREGATVAGLRAELYADAIAAAIGGPRSMDDLLDGELAEAAAGTGTATPLAGVPAIERERRRRLAIATGSRMDSMHPTFAARFTMLTALATGPTAEGLTGRRYVAVRAADLDTATRELDAIAARAG